MSKNIELLIPDTGIQTHLKTLAGTIICNAYERIVYGDKGPYIEFTKNQIYDQAFYIPRSLLWKLSDPKVYYIEFRSNDGCNVKLYYQLRTVKYADYKMGYFYISPKDLLTSNNESCIVIDSSNENANSFFNFN